MLLRRPAADRARRALRRGALAAALAALAGCGGGISFGFGFGDDDFFDRSAPTVSLAAPASAPAGSTIVLSAAASDVSGIDSVAFYQLDGGAATLLGADGSAPFAWNVALPNAPGASVSFFARATDGVGRQGDSEAVTVAITN